MLGNASKRVIIIIELSKYKLYMGHIHTLVLTREWIDMLIPHKGALPPCILNGAP